jgi:hypothetical protein
MVFMLHDHWTRITMFPVLVSSYKVTGTGAGSTTYQRTTNTVTYKATNYGTTGTAYYGALTTPTHTMFDLHLFLGVGHRNYTYRKK